MTEYLTTPAPLRLPVPADSLPLATIGDAALLPLKVPPPPAVRRFGPTPLPANLRDPATLTTPGA